MFDIGSSPVGIAAARGHVWITNNAANSIVDLPQRGRPVMPDAAIHACVRTTTRAVTLPAMGSRCSAGTVPLSWNITGRPGTGAGPGWGTVVSGPKYQFNSPAVLATDGSDIWAANTGSNSLTEVNAAGGGLVRVVSGAGYQFDHPTAMVADNQGDIWVANTGSNSLTEVNAADGSLVQVVSGASYAFSSPDGLAFDGDHIWVSNASATSLTEINANDGTLASVVPLQVISGDQTGADAVLFANGHIWVAANVLNNQSELAELTTAGVMVGHGVPVDRNLTSLAFDGTYVWAAATDGSAIFQFAVAGRGAPELVRDPDFTLYGFSSAVAVAAGRVWSADGRQNRLNELPKPSPGE